MIDQTRTPQSGQRLQAFPEVTVGLATGESVPAGDDVAQNLQLCRLAWRRPVFLRRHGVRSASATNTGSVRAVRIAAV